MSKMWRDFILQYAKSNVEVIKFQVNPKILITDRDEGENAKLNVVCSTKEKGSDAEACATFRVETDMVSCSWKIMCNMQIKPKYTTNKEPLLFKSNDNATDPVQTSWNYS